MGFRFRRSLKIAPGVHLNIGTTGKPSISIGVRGAHVTIGPKGVTRSVGIPGTGISYTDRAGGNESVEEKPLPTVVELPTAKAAARRLRPAAPSFPSNPVSYEDRAAGIRRRRYNVAIACVAVAIVGVLAWPYVMRLLAGEP